MINPSITLLVLTLIFNGVLGFVVWQRAPHKAVNKIFALLTLSFMFWSATGYYEQTASGSEGLFYAMVGVPFIGGIFMAYFIALFSLYFPENHPNSPKTRYITAWLLNITTIPLVALLVFGLKFMVANVTTSATMGNNIVVGPLYVLFPLYFVGWVLFGLVNLVKKFRKSKDHLLRLQLSYIFLGFLSFAVVALATNVALPTLAGNPTLARYGFVSTLFIVGVFSYTIVAHRLFNIRLLVARSVAYSLLLITLSTIYGLSIFAVGVLFFPQSGINKGELSIFIALAIVLAFTFEPLRRFFEHITDGLFFRDRYDSQNVLNNVGSIMAGELMLDTLLDKTLKEICGNLRINTARFVIYAQGEIFKRAFYGMTPQQLMATQDIHKLRPGMLVADEIGSGQRKNLLTRNHVRVSVELWANDEVVGHLLLGDKLSGDMYSTQDLAVLEILRKELAIAITNARAYEEIAHFNTTLQDRVTKATAHLRAANVKLEVLDKAKDDFISMASHQLGTPLAAITGYLSMAINEDRNNMTESQRDSVSVALESAERLVNMASDLLNVSRLNAGRFSIVRQPVDLSRMIQQEVVQLEPSAGRKGLELTFTPPAKPMPLVPIDESKTRQVIMNFIDNAIYYTPKGSVKVSLAEDSGHVTLKVTDTGMGVPPEDVEKLFAKFYRAQNAKDSRPDGTGLGLYLAKKVIEDQGGELIFETKLGQGSTFGFRLPMKPKPIKHIAK